nr:YcaO-like family protein [Paracoccaceae bacterium]
VLRRASLDADGIAAFAPLPPARTVDAAPAGLDGLVERLASLGIEVFAVDLPAAAGGLAVAKVFAPGLQPLPGPGARPNPDAPGAYAALM